MTDPIQQAVQEAIDAIRIEVPGPLLRVLRNLEVAAREVDTHLDPANRGELRGEWIFGGRRVSAEASSALLILHDCLNDLRELGGEDW